MRISPLIRNLGVLVVISLVILVLNLQTSLITASFLLSAAFLIAMALVAYLLWRDFGRREIDLWPRQKQWVFYSAIGLFVVDVGWFFFNGLTGPDLLAFFLVAAACIYAAIRTWRSQNSYG